MFELIIFVVLSMTLECGIGILWGVGVGYNPLLVFIASIGLNYLTIIIVVSLIDRLLRWRKGAEDWLKKKLARGQKLIDKYGSLGIIMGVFILSPVQLAIIGRMLCMKPTKLYPTLLVAIIIVATAYLAIALGILKILL